MIPSNESVEQAKQPGRPLTAGSLIKHPLHSPATRIFVAARALSFLILLVIGHADLVRAALFVKVLVAAWYYSQRREAGSLLFPSSASWWE